MTEQPTILEAADKRRAALLLRYLNPAAPNIGAANTILSQAHDAGRGTHLVIAVAAIAYTGIDLDTEAGQCGLAELALEQYEIDNTTEV